MEGETVEGLAGPRSSGSEDLVLELQEENAVLRVALGFYADEGNWAVHVPLDKGHVARSALGV